MAEKLKKNDFVELDYTGRVKGGQVFDTNIDKELKKLNMNAKAKIMVVCIGQNMILPAIDQFLIGKEAGKSYKLELPPEKAFGKRKRELIKIIPMSVFRKQNVSPQIGMVFSFDNLLGKITTVSGGRVIVDFNNPIAGKEVIYELNIKRKLTEQREKIKSLMSIFFKQDLDFQVNNKELAIKVPSKLEKFAEVFKPKFKEILDLELKIERIKEEK